MNASNNLAMQEDLKAAGYYWGDDINKALTQRFGKDKVGYLLVLATAGGGGGMTINTNLEWDSVVTLLRELADKIAGGLPGRRAN